MTVLGRVGRAPAVALWVDPKVHAAEVARFRSKIVAGPGDGDCSIWIGDRVLRVVLRLVVRCTPWAV